MIQVYDRDHTMIDSLFSEKMPLAWENMAKVELTAHDLARLAEEEQEAAFRAHGSLNTPYAIETEEHAIERRRLYNIALKRLKQRQGHTVMFVKTTI